MDEFDFDAEEEGGGGGSEIRGTNIRKGMMRTKKSTDYSSSRIQSGVGSKRTRRNRLNKGLSKIQRKVDAEHYGDDNDGLEFESTETDPTTNDEHEVIPASTNVPLNGDTQEFKESTPAKGPKHNDSSQSTVGTRCRRRLVGGIGVKSDPAAKNGNKNDISSLSPSSATSFSSSISQGRGAKRKKRHRLNNVIGSSNIESVEEIENDHESEVVVPKETSTESIIPVNTKDSSADLHTLSQDKNTTEEGKKEDKTDSDRNAMKPPSASVRNNTRLSRRRKRNLPGTKTTGGHSKTSNTSLSDFSGSPSFLSSMKSPDKSWGSRSLKNSMSEQGTVGTRSLNSHEELGIGHSKMGHFGTPPGSPSSADRRYNLQVMNGVKEEKNIQETDMGEADDETSAHVRNSSHLKQCQSHDDESISSRIALRSKKDHNPIIDTKDASSLPNLPDAKESDDVDLASTPASRRSNRSSNLVNPNTSRIRSKYLSHDSDSRSVESSNANSSIVSYGSSEKVFTGAGTDVYAVQDAGTFRLLLDDCNYFCSSFLTGVGADEESRNRERTNGHGQGSKKHSSITAHASCDMAVILSSKKNRGIVMSKSFTSAAADVDQDSDELTDQSICQSILNIIGFVPISMLGSHLPPPPIDNYEHEKKLCRDDLIDWNEILDKSGMNVTEAEEMISQTAVFSTGRRRTKRGRQNDVKADEPVSVYDTVVANALATSAYFISLDCTMDKMQSAMASRKATEQLRRRILKNKNTICGISKLIMADHVVTTILDGNNPESKDIEDTISNNGTSIENEPVPKNRVDPTSRGRRRKRRRKIESSNMDCNSIHTIPENEITGEEIGGKEGGPRKLKNFDFVSDEASSRTGSLNSEVSSLSSRVQVIPSRFKQKLDNAQGKMQVKNSAGYNGAHPSSSHTCQYCTSFNNFHKTHANTGYLALQALDNIVNTKCEGDNDEIDQGDDICDDDSSNGIHSVAENIEGESIDIENKNLTNPLIFKNVMLRRSGAIPHLARAMVESLEAANILAVDLDSNLNQRCSTCSEYLKDKIFSLSSLIDGLCLMSEENRKMFCRVAIKSKSGIRPILLPALLKSFSKFALSSLSESQSVFADIGLSALRTLTSLTHENDVGCAQFLATYTICSPTSSLKKVDGVEIMCQMMHMMADKQSTSQHIYDSIVLCLNSLTNILESSSFPGVCNSILNHEIGEEGGRSALSWLSRFVVNQTEPFRDAVVSGQFGKENQSDGKHDSRDLESHEDEYLITAGNGFILLSCFLGAGIEGKIASKEIMRKIKNIIFAQIPGESDGEKLTLVMNTLKAFCNFYRYSIGDLSLAVIAPVLKLISGLEKLKV